MRRRLRIRKKGISAKGSVRNRKPHTRSSKLRIRKRLNDCYNQGFDKGYNQAMLYVNHRIIQPDKSQEIANEEEYVRGLYDGGDGIVNSILPEYEILPDIHIRQIIEAGIEQLRPQIHKLLNASDVGDRVEHALLTRLPLSVVRLGDGELLTLAQEVVMNEEQVKKNGHFLGYAGVNIPDLEARDQLVSAIRKASIVGIPILRMANFQPFSFAVFKAHGIDYKQLQLTSSTINYSLYLEGKILKFVANRRVLVVGNTAMELSKVLLNRGIKVVGVVTPVNGIHDIPRVMNEIAVHDYDIALVGAGIAAVIIAQQIASVHGKVALDFGHLADAFIKGEAVL